MHLYIVYFKYVCMFVCMYVSNVPLGICFRVSTWVVVRSSEWVLLVQCTRVWIFTCWMTHSVLWTHMWASTSLKKSLVQEEFSRIKYVLFLTWYECIMWLTFSPILLLPSSSCIYSMHTYAYFPNSYLSHFTPSTMYIDSYLYLCTSPTNYILSLWRVEVVLAEIWEDNSPTLHL